MSKYEKDLSEYIDMLNAEKKPKEHENDLETPELEELMNTVRLVKGLKEPILPDSNFPKRVAQNTAEKLSQKAGATKIKKRWFVGFGTAAVAVIMIFLLNLAFSKNNIVFAMEQAFQGIKAYHGILEITETNGAGETILQGKREVWANKDGQYYIKELEGSQKGMITVNNGEKKWQLRPDSKQIIAFAAFPDPYRFTFEIGKEVENVKNALETKVLGQEKLSGRIAVILEVSPQGGAAYKLWVDQETKLPLKKQSAMQNAVQYTITYTNIDFGDAIPAELIAYQIPAEYEEVSTNTEQLVNHLEEAEAMVGFAPRVITEIPEEYMLNHIAVELDDKIVKSNYSSKNNQSRIVVLQGKAVGDLKPASTAALGKVGSNIAELQSPIEANTGVLIGGGAYAGTTNISSIRWQENGFEYAVLGDGDIEDLRLFVEGITKETVLIPQDDEIAASKPQVEVQADLEVEENEQKSVDAGHTPWKLDPVFVAQVFVSLKISPEGIVGEYPVQYEDFTVKQNTGKAAIIEVSGDKTPICRVYLKKLVREDSTGIWTVVGYDNIEKE
ncbi:MAG: hypothetical protein K0Q99_2074 [Clostridia bacterium]|jgi:outer membrane lipoprotein-sorting protein|nr:hypothetical protein [Clostridia bacterium]